MEITFEVSLQDLIEKGVGVAACAAGCVYGGALLYPMLPLKALEQAALYAALGLTALAITPRTYSWINANIQDVFDGTVARVQEFIEGHPLMTILGTASACAIGCFSFKR